MSSNDKAVPTGNPVIDIELKVHIRADFLTNGKPLTAGWLERRVREVLRDRFDGLATILTVVRLPSLPTTPTRIPSEDGEGVLIERH